MNEEGAGRVAGMRVGDSRRWLVVVVGGRWSVLLFISTTVAHTHTCRAVPVLSGQAHASCCSLAAAGDAG